MPTAVYQLVASTAGVLLSLTAENDTQYLGAVVFLAASLIIGAINNSGGAS